MLDNLLSSVNSHIETNFVSTLNNNLRTLDFEDDVIDSLNDISNSISDGLRVDSFTSNDILEALCLDNLLDLFDLLKRLFNFRIFDDLLQFLLSLLAMLQAILNMKIQLNEELLSKVHDTQDNKVAFKRLDFSIDDKVTTSPPKVTNPDYSLDEDYPDSYGYVDRVLNWFKVNKKQKTAEVVHPSGSFVKIDKVGNFVKKITGAFKQIVMKDFTTKVLGSYDLIIDGSQYIKVNSNIQIISGKKITMKAPLIILDTPLTQCTGSLKVAKEIDDMLGTVTHHEHSVKDHSVAVKRG